MDIDDDVTPASPWKTRLLLVVIAAAVLVGVGSIGQLSGAGWFSYRTWLYERGDLYALNLSDAPLWVSVDGQSPRLVEPENAAIISVLGGDSVITVSDAEDGAPTDRYDLTINGSHALLKLTDDGCLAVVDITGFYTGTAKGELDFAARLRRDTRIWVASSRNVVWPRRDFPPKLIGGEGDGLWVETVACELLDDTKFLDAYLAIRIEGRMAKALGKD